MEQTFHVESDVSPDGYYELVTALEDRAEGHRIEGNDERADTCLAIAETFREQVAEQR